jgi:hypothetical protein
VDSRYFLFDGRWWTDKDAATVLCTAETLKEALDDYELFSDDTVIVDSNGNAVYCKMTGFDRGVTPCEPVRLSTN